ncbi:putative reverse transcriptase domain-containing protein [Tanacetum coccineum]
MPNIRSGASMTREEFKELVNRRVAEEMEAREATRTLEPLNENVDEQEGENGGNGGNGNEGNGENGNRNRNGNHGMNYGGFMPVSSEISSCTTAGHALTWKQLDCLHSRVSGVDFVKGSQMKKKSVEFMEGYAARSAENKERRKVWKSLYEGWTSTTNCRVANFSKHSEAPLEISSFDVIIGMDWLAKYNGSVDTFVMRFVVRIPYGNEVLIIRCDNYDSGITSKKADDKSEEKRLEDVPIPYVNFQKFFPEELLDLPPPARQAEFQIDLVPGAAPVARAPYRLAPAEMQELPTQLQELSDRTMTREKNERDQYLKESSLKAWSTGFSINPDHDGNFPSHFLEVSHKALVHLHSTLEKVDKHYRCRIFSYNNSYHTSIKAAPFEALYGCKCRSPICWTEVGDSQLTSPEIIYETTERIVQIKSHISTAQIQEDDKLNFIEEPVEIMDREVKVFCNIVVFRLSKCTGNSKKRSYSPGKRYFEQTSAIDFPDNEITSDSNIIMYSQYLQETQQEKANQEKNNESLTAELERYKERVKTFEQRLNIDLSTREKMIDSQMDDMIKEKLALKQQIDSLEQNLSNQIKEKESLL